MPTDSLNPLLTRLEEGSRQFGRGAARRIEKLLSTASAKQFRDAPPLIRFHEALMFLRAFPHGAGVVGKTERLLNNFHTRVEKLHDEGASMSAFDPMEVSGIAGTVMEEMLTFDEVRWLVQRIPGKVQIAWDDAPEDRALAATWPRFFPLLDEDGLVEADTPWMSWLLAAKGSHRRELEWLLERFERLPLSARDQAELYDSLHLTVRWALDNLRLSRTRNWRSPRRVFYQKAPLLTRREVLLAKELARPAPALRLLPPAQRRPTLDLIREVMLVRHRELYGTTLGDPNSLVSADVGRGVTMFLCNLPPDRRLPLRAYAAGFTLKNGVPINYFEANALFEWVEVGFNTFYTFRDGETAWVYAQALRCLCKLMGATCISVYPFQIGHKNEEAIESGAFWFYRKLGFRPGRPDLLRLTLREEARMQSDPKHRSSARTLRRLAEGHMFYELPGSEVGAWDNFSTRNIGLAVNRKMTREFSGDSARIRQASTSTVARILGMNTSRWQPLEQVAFENFALVLALIPDLSQWERKEKLALVEVIRAKTGRNEMHYLRLMRRHGRFREAMLKLGSQSRSITE